MAEMVTVMKIVLSNDESRRNEVKNRVDRFSPKLELDFGASWADVGWYGDPKKQFSTLLQATFVIGSFYKANNNKKTGKND